MSDETGWTEAHRAEAQTRLAAARARGDVYAQARALVDLVVITRRLGNASALITYAGSAWETAERYCFWDQLARLAIVFGDVAYSGQDYQQCYDHYANACAYALMAGSADLRAVLARVDQVLAGMLGTGRASQALAFCELLLAYEAEGGLGQADPAFAAHFREWQRQAEDQARAELAPTAARLN